MLGDGAASTEMERRGVADPIRVLLCKSGLEEHDRGVRFLARRLRDEGMEVIYVVFHDPAEAALAAVQEDVAVLGLSSSAGGHIEVVRRIRDELRKHNAGDIVIIAGGVIPDSDNKRLQALDVAGIFGPGSNPAAIASAIRTAVASRAPHGRFPCREE